MKRHALQVVGLLAFGLVAGLSAGRLMATEFKAADATGTWKWTFQRPNGGDPIEFTLTLKQEGEKLTGTLKGFGGNETEIADGKANGSDVSFTVTREFNGNKFTSKYSGKVEGDAIKGKVESERNGQTRTRDWEAKRSAEKA